MTNHRHYIVDAHDDVISQTIVCSTPESAARTVADLCNMSEGEEFVLRDGWSSFYDWTILVTSCGCDEPASHYNKEEIV